MEDSHTWMPYAASTKLYFGDYAQWFRQLLVLWFTLRWKVTYPLQIRVSKFATVGELIFVALAILMLVSSTSGNWMAFSMGGEGEDEDEEDDDEDRRRLDDDGVEGSGKATTFWMALAFLTATRNSPLTFLVGIPFERQLFWHKLFAYASIGMGLYHGITAGDGDDRRRRLTGRRLDDDEGTATTGWVAQAALIGLGLTSLPPVRRLAFEFFYRMHWILIFLAAAYSILHHARGFLPGMIVWLVDVGIRAILLAHCPLQTSLRVNHLGSGVVKLSWPNSHLLTGYKAGQYVFICIPELGLFEWHPFSLSSAPHDQETCVHIRALGDWTHKLSALAAERNGGTVDAFIEGPYGECMVDVEGPAYSRFLLVSGGIGVTPLQSVANDIMYAHTTQGRPLQKIDFIWSVAEPSMVSSLGVTTEAASGDGTVVAEAAIVQKTQAQVIAPGGKGACLQVLPGAFTPDLRVHEWMSGADMERGIGVSSASAVSAAIEMVDISPGKAGATVAGAVVGATANANANTNTNTGAGTILDANYFLTRVTPAEFTTITADVDPLLQPRLRCGRPDLRAIFQKAKDEALAAVAAGDPKAAYVAVLTCGPLGMVNDAQQLAFELSGDGMRFDFHKEIFEF
jgi:NAD(P)H-flavin reductase